MSKSYDSINVGESLLDQLPLADMDVKSVQIQASVGDRPVADLSYREDEAQRADNVKRRVAVDGEPLEDAMAAERLQFIHTVTIVATHY